MINKKSIKAAIIVCALAQPLPSLSGGKNIPSKTSTESSVMAWLVAGYVVASTAVTGWLVWDKVCNKPVEHTPVDVSNFLTKQTLPGEVKQELIDHGFLHQDGDELVRGWSTLEESARDVQLAIQKFAVESGLFVPVVVEQARNVEKEDLQGAALHSPREQQELRRRWVAIEDYLPLAEQVEKLEKASKTFTTIDGLRSAIEAMPKMPTDYLARKDFEWATEKSKGGYLILKESKSK